MRRAAARASQAREAVERADSVGLPPPPRARVTRRGVRGKRKREEALPKEPTGAERAASASLAPEVYDASPPPPPAKRAKKQESATWAELREEARDEGEATPAAKKMPRSAPSQVPKKPAASPVPIGLVGETRRTEATRVPMPKVPKTRSSARLLPLRAKAPAAPIGAAPAPGAPSRPIGSAPPWRSGARGPPIGSPPSGRASSATGVLRARRGILRARPSIGRGKGVSAGVNLRLGFAGAAARTARRPPAPAAASSSVQAAAPAELQPATGPTSVRRAEEAEEARSRSPSWITCSDAEDPPAPRAPRAQRVRGDERICQRFQRGKCRAGKMAPRLDGSRDQQPRLLRYRPSRQR